jgi:hypothetical protein
MFDQQPFITPGKTATFICCALTIGTFSLVLVTIGFFLLVVYLLGLMLTALTEQCSHIVVIYSSWPPVMQACVWLVFVGCIIWRVPRANWLVRRLFAVR